MQNTHDDARLEAPPAMHSCGFGETRPDVTGLMHAMRIGNVMTRPAMSLGRPGSESGGDRGNTPFLFTRHD